MESVRPPRQGRQRALTMVFAAAGLAVMAVVAWKSWRIGVEHWYIAKLESEDLDTREHAAARLAAMASVRAVPYLIEALARGPDGRDVTLWSIGDGPPEFRPVLTDAIAAAGIGALPGLERKLRAEVPMERFWAASMIGRFGDGAHGAAGSLFPLLSDESPRVRSEAAGALGLVGWRSPEVLQRLGEALGTRARSSELRQSSIEALTAAARIASLLRDEAAVRLEAGETASTVLAHLAAALEDENDAVRRKAISAFFDALRWSGNPPPRWPPRFDPEPALVRLAAHEEPTVRGEAVLLLAKTGRFSGPALAVLARALGDREVDVRKAARLELRVKGPTALPVWIAALETDEPVAWEAAADALAAMGASARSAWPRLLEKLLDAREDSVESLATALGRIGAASGIGVPELVSALASVEPAAARRGAAEALGLYDTAASAAGPSLLDALADEDPGVRRAAALAVVSTRGVPLAALVEKAVPVLAACLGDDDPLIWWRAGEALVALGPAAKGAVSALTRALRDRHGLVNPWALRALEAIGPDAEAAVPAILSIIAEDDGKSRLDAVRAIRAIGPDLAIPGPAERR